MTLEERERAFRREYQLLVEQYGVTLEPIISVNNRAQLLLETLTLRCIQVANWQPPASAAESATPDQS